MAGGGTQQPLAPGLGLLAVAGVEQRIQGQGGVAQPAMAIVPIAAAAQLLRQRRGGRGDDAAGRLEGQQLQRDQRTHHRVAARAGAVGPVAALGPFVPPGDGAVHAFHAVGHEMRRLVRAVVRQGERHGLPLPHAEGGHAFHVAAFQRHGGVQFHRVRAGDGAQPVIAPPHPRHRLPIVEAQRQLHLHVHVAGVTLDDAHHVDPFFVVAERHEIVDTHRAGGGLVARFQHGRVGQVAAPDLARPARRQQPAAVAVVAEQGGETRGGIEMRQAQPVDGAVARDQRRRQQVADHAIVLNGLGHGSGRVSRASMAAHPGTHAGLLLVWKGPGRLRESRSGGRCHGRCRKRRP